MSHEAMQLVLVKQFADEADRMLTRETAFGDGQAVSMMQDAVELLIRAVALTRNIEVPPRATIDQMSDAIGKVATDEAGKVPHRTRIEDLNKARVAFKHSGIAPSRDDARRLMRYGIEFLEVAVPRFFDIEYRRISLSQSVRSPEIRLLLETAAFAASEGRHNDAMADVAEAVGLVERMLSQVLPLPSSPIRLSGADGKALDELLKYLAGLRNVSVAAMMQFDLRELIKFRMVAPRVMRSQAGQRQVVHNGPVQYTLEQAEGGLAFATSFALSVQARMS